MNEQELISVIVPVYKVEPYLRACIDSVLAQTYQNLEVILVDDGSPDNSGAICDEYAARDCRVRVIHQENGGLCVARNAGLDAAKGAYIAFVDSDDYIEPNMYQILYERLQETGADAAQCGYVRYEKNGTVWNVFGSGKNGVYDGPQFVEKMLTEYSPWWTQWGKLYCVELFQNRRFNEELRTFEDILMNTQIFLSVRRVVFVKEPLYHWIWHPDSLTDLNPRSGVDLVSAALMVWREIEQRHSQFYGLGCRHFVKNAIYAYEYPWPGRDRYSRQACAETKNFVRIELRKALPSILKTPECGKKFKIKTYLITKMPRLYSFLFSIWLKATKWRRNR